MKEFYDTNESFKRYVDRECVQHNLTIEACLERSWVRNAYEYYKGAEKGKMSVVKVDAGCGGEK